ncbi:response regulator transcription factor [Sphingomonas faeni]|uniref:response regulator transcription factor n=1 Tax=Sphingomonas faeni TaxID=185950 RepID=UPI0020BDE8C0|nr:response regulator [Sphingomonas faeni]MCK8458536.1 response regulator [Sphingomonas faeni]
MNQSNNDLPPKPLFRIIYVEDDDLIADIVKSLLTDAGYLIGVISHGTLAYETIAFKKPDLVILDRSLPGMQGIEILRRLRATPDTYLIPVLMLTATGGHEQIDEGLGAGADGYLVKPFEPDVLIRKVESIIANSLFKRPAPRP